jgi:hypothetical protein
MPALTPPLFGFAFGAASAWLASEEISRAGSVAGTRSIWVVALFGVLVLAPAAAYLLAFSPDWSYAYYLDSRRIPMVAPLSLVLLDATSAPAGFAAAARAAGARRAGAVARLALIPACLSLAMTVAVLPRLSVYATHAQYHGDFGTESVAGSPLGWALLWMGGLLALSIAWTIHVLRRIGSPPPRH